ncbi:hypothetical protein TorRG33x02_071960 [Trema orientale]|uniref:Uncharacterized protein n=1 Tax=Trema orientale TaxID=63057 RepID=A0A2P5FH98_TREOI|nr:hypothetical protein TorRG33x02_071960 [Trema orientale]
MKDLKAKLALLHVAMVTRDGPIMFSAPSSKFFSPLILLVAMPLATLLSSFADPHPPLILRCFDSPSRTFVSDPLMASASMPDLRLLCSVRNLAATSGYSTVVLSKALPSASMVLHL